MFLGGRRFSEGTSADREIQRTLMEVSKRHYDIVISHVRVVPRYPMETLIWRAMLNVPASHPSNSLQIFGSNWAFLFLNVGLHLPPYLYFEN